MKSYCKKYLLFLILLLTFSISGCGEEEQIKVTDTRFSMDTFVKIDAYSDKPGEARLAIDDAMQTFQKTAQVTDRFNDGGPGSLYEANSKAAAAPVTLAPQLAGLLNYLDHQPDAQLDIAIAPVVDLWQLARSQNRLPAPEKLQESLRHTGKDKYHFDAAAQTLSYNDPDVKLDLGSVAKGYAVDAAAATLKKHSGITCALINAGGNIKAIGNKCLFGHGRNVRLGDILIERTEKSTINDQYEILSSTIKGIFSQRDYFSKDIASENNIGYKILHKGDIVLSPQNLWMGNINYNDKFDFGIVSPSYKVFAISKEFDCLYVAFLLKTHRSLYSYRSISEQGASIV